MHKNTRFAWNLFIVVVGMVMLAYASVPLYRLFCSVTGYGGTSRRAVAAPKEISGRKITVTFNADIAPGLDWQFKPGERSHVVHVGEQALTYFVARNLENHAVTARAVYNVVPFKAGQYFTKIACFCFEEQKLAAHQQAKMPVSFFIDPAMLNDPDMDDVTTITLSYTFFPVKK